MRNQEKIFVIGHKNPDTDSICSAIAYCDIKNRTSQKQRFVPKRAGQINEETEYVLSRFGVQPPGYLSNIGTQVKDMDIRMSPDADKSMSLKAAWDIMQENSIVSLPIRDKMCIRDRETVEAEEISTVEEVSEPEEIEETVQEKETKLPELEIPEAMKNVGMENPLHTEIPKAPNICLPGAEDDDTQDFEFNLEDMILEAATAQGIEIPKEPIVEEKTPVQEVTEEELSLIHILFILLS